MYMDTMQMDILSLLSLSKPFFWFQLCNMINFFLLLLEEKWFLVLKLIIFRTLAGGGKEELR